MLSIKNEIRKLDSLSDLNEKTLQYLDFLYEITILKYGDDGLTAIFDYSEGWFRGYFKNGNLRYEWEYIEGKRADGISRSWYENKQIKKERDMK